MNPNCRSGCITFGEWQAQGCANQQNNRSPLVRISERIRDSVESLDDRFERAFYGDSLGTGFNNAAGQQGFQGGFQGQGFQGQQGFQGGFQANKVSRVAKEDSLGHLQEEHHRL